MSINKAILIGRLTRTPELRNTTTGKQVVNFSIAVDDRFDKDHTNFFNVVAWAQAADFVSKYLDKGSLVAVDGRLSQRKYTTQDGQDRTVVEIVADNVQGLDRPTDSQPTQDEDDPFVGE